jgi:putative nucleotidyltransferase with HDIG domain
MRARQRLSGSSSMSAPLAAFIAPVVAAGVAIIAQSARTLELSSINGYALGLAALTIVSGRFAIKVPGRPATVSVSEVFVFASVLLFGPSIAVITVAIDGLWISLTQHDRRLYRALFNVAEPAISTWAAAHAFLMVAGTQAGSPLSTGMATLVPAAVAMSAAFFALNSGLSAIAVALENGTSVYQVWRSHAWYLAVNYHAAASIATLAVSAETHVNFGVVGLIAPLLILSYVAYREASGRVGEAQQHVADVERLYRASVEMLAIAVDAKDQLTHGHIRRVQRHTRAVADAVGVTDARELKAIEAGALLHDIGKLAVPDYVLNKPSALTPAEFETMKKHASMGARILAAVEFPYPVVPIVRHHHERWDGRGYPDNLIGTEIPLGARILSVVDCFDALTSDRPYRPRMTDDEAIEILRSRKGTFYDPAVVEKFIELIPELRRNDETVLPVRDAHASVVAGLARIAAPDLRAEPHEGGHSPVAAPASAVRRIDEQIGSIGGAHACLFAMNAAQDGLVVAHASAGIRRAIEFLNVPLGSGVSGWVAANRSTIRRAESVLDLGGVAETFGLRACVSVPVFARAELYGVITAYVADPMIPDQTVDAVGVLAQEIGLCIARDTAPFAQWPSLPGRRRSIAAVS